MSPGRVAARRLVLLRQPAAYVGLLGGCQRPTGRHRAADAEGRAVHIRGGSPEADFGRLTAEVQAISAAGAATYAVKSSTTVGGPYTVVSGAGALTDRTRAIIAVHLAGTPCDMTALLAIS